MLVVLVMGLSAAREPSASTPGSHSSSLDIRQLMPEGNALKGHTGRRLRAADEEEGGEGEEEGGDEDDEEDEEEEDDDKGTAPEEKSEASLAKAVENRENAARGGQVASAPAVVAGGAQTAALTLLETVDLRIGGARHIIKVADKMDKPLQAFVGSAEENLQGLDDDEAHQALELKLDAAQNSSDRLQALIRRAEAVEAEAEKEAERLKGAEGGPVQAGVSGTGAAAPPDTAGPSLVAAPGAAAV